ncbi:MAG TPA: trypsin-like peptidase domain-containing protein [Candidatus Kapabacteria bacterium]|nr:trypsin-like peptidase domain-containing protein [Candidatus Kapabacteria bacterium]
MHLLLFYFLSFVSLGTPIAGCSQQGNGAHVYTVSQHSPNLDSVNATITGTRRNAITAAVAKASPAVVGINVTAIEERQLWNPFADDPFFRQFFGGNRTEKYQVKALGSGFIISPDGYILTNDHVAGNAAKIIVTTTDGSQYDAKLVGTDRNSDISLLKIDGKRLPYIKLGNSDDLAVGEWAIAMGNPFGLFSINDKPTVTVGVISNTGVNLGLEEGRNYRDMIQTDAAISSGNSGGPLLNANGEVIGMNATIRTTATNYQGEAGSIGLGFAIPINRIKTVVDRLRSGEKMNHDIGDIGMEFQDVNDQTREYFKLTSDIGVVVTQLERGGVADKAGIEAGDLIVGFDNEKIRGSGELESALADHLVGDEVTFRIDRDGKHVIVRMKLPGK